MESSIVGSGVSPNPSSLLDNTVTSRHSRGFYTRIKMIGMGKIIEVYEFQAPINVGRKGKSYRPRLEFDEIEDILVNPEKYHKNHIRSEEYRKRNVIKAKNRIRRLVQRNFDTVGKFLTLTFRDTQVFDVNSLEDCHLRFYGFIRRLRQEYPKVRYVGVPEFQKRGAVHYHLLVDIPYTPVEKLRLMWSHGFIKINKIHNPAYVGVYIAKYVGKAFADERYSGHRCFYTSKNLSKPVVVYGEQLWGKLQAIQAKGFLPTYEKTYHSKWCGQITYQSYNLYQPPAQNGVNEST
jgi:hypothetical protein